MWMDFAISQAFTDLAARGLLYLMPEAIGLECSESIRGYALTSFASRRVTRVVERIMDQRGAPQAIRCENGPELTSRHFLA
jgi:hypothetical protein